MDIAALVIAVIAALAAIAAAVFTWFLHRDSARAADAAEASEGHASRSADAAQASARVAEEHLHALREPVLHASLEDAAEGGRFRLSLLLEAGAELTSLTLRTANDGGVMVFESSRNITLTDGGKQVAVWPEGLRLGETAAWFCSSRDGSIPVPFQVVVVSRAGERSWQALLTVDPPEPWAGVILH